MKGQTKWIVVGLVICVVILAVFFTPKTFFSKSFWISKYITTKTMLHFHGESQLDVLPHPWHYPENRNTNKVEKPYTFQSIAFTAPWDTVMKTKESQNGDVLLMRFQGHKTHPYLMVEKKLNYYKKFIKGKWHHSIYWLGVDSDYEVYRRVLQAQLSDIRFRSDLERTLDVGVLLHLKYLMTAPLSNGGGKIFLFKTSQGIRGYVFMNMLKKRSTITFFTPKPESRTYDLVLSTVDRSKVNTVIESLRLREVTH